MDDPRGLKVEGSLVPGSSPTLAEATLDPGIATLQRSAFSSDPRAAAALTKRQLEQNAARVEALRKIGGDAGELDFHRASRSSSAEDLYKRAFAEVPEDSAWIKGRVNLLMKRPAFVSALKDAQELAMNEGIKISPKNPENTTQLLHYTKMALDGRIGESVARGSNTHGLQSTRDALVSLMESKGFAPSYREARDTFRQMSGPINRMEVGKEIERRTLNNLDDALGNPTLTPAKFANAIKDEGGIVRAATGHRKGSFADALRPEDVSMLEAIRPIQRKVWRDLHFSCHKFQVANDWIRCEDGVLKLDADISWNPII